MWKKRLRILRIAKMKFDDVKIGGQYVYTGASVQDILYNTNVTVREIQEDLEPEFGKIYVNNGWGKKVIAPVLPNHLEPIT